MLEQGCATLLQGHEISGFVVGNAVEPAAVQDADPLGGEGTQRGLVAGAASLVGLIEGFRPNERGMVWAAHSTKVWRTSLLHP